MMYPRTSLALALAVAGLTLLLQWSDVDGLRCSRVQPYTSYYKCGSWWRRRRCSRTRYRTVYSCCPGYSPAPSCPNINECASSPCVFGRCLDNVNSYSCSCSAGYSGNRCEQDINECSNRPCQNGGTCRNQVNSFTCVCPIGFTGVQCEIDIDECASVAVSCLNGGTCQNGKGEFTCNCQQGYSGRKCEFNNNVCGTSSPCVYGQCLNTGENQYSCDCADGWTGTNCDEDIQDCASDPCDNDGVCLDGQNGFVCFCNEGYTGNTCALEEDNCAHTFCENGATCNNGIGTFTCTCALGYVGRFCEQEINECNSHPCQNGGSCVEKVGRYECTCLRNYIGDNCQQQLDAINDCAGDPCQNDAECVDDVFTYRCKCPDGFEGFDCEINKDECTDDATKCVNGGLCSDDINKANCTCWNGYTGPRCEIDINECLSAPCVNGGVCDDRINGYTCDSCDDGFVGDNCEDEDTSATLDQVSDQIEGVATTNIAILVVVLIIAIAIIVMAVVVVIRKQRHQPVIPPTVRESASRIRNAVSNRFSRHPTQTNNYSYAAALAAGGDDQKKHASINVMYPEDEEDMYVYGQMETDPKASWKTSTDKVTIGKKLAGAKGRFADIHLAEMRDKNGTTTVVAKINKVSATPEDKLLMKAKTNFYGTKVRPHENIVNLVAALPDSPTLLLEYCEEGKLIDWLHKIMKIDEEVEENMVNFCIQIARGMNHLHRLEILHRRLGARNVLLKKNNNQQLVAKLSGFGPMRGEQGSSDNSKERIPIKWMAPEQLNKQKHEMRHYSKETDVWSYAITTWEIFSKGETPYPKLSVGEVSGKLRNGYRCQRPASCPDFIWDEVVQECWKQDARERPGFETILNSLCHYYNSQGNDNYAYDAESAPSYYSNN